MKLTTEQKKILDQYIGVALSMDELPIDVQNELISINDDELLYQNADRYLMDKTFERQYARV